MTKEQRYRDGATLAVLGMQNGLGILRQVPKTVGRADNAALATTVDQILGWESATMAKKAGDNGAEAKHAWTRFVNIALTGYTKEDIRARYDAWDDFTGDLTSLLSSGYRIGVSFDEGNNSFIASVTCRATGDPNEGCTFTSFAGDWVTALQVALFKHYVVVAGVWDTKRAADDGGAFG